MPHGHITHYIYSSTMPIKWPLILFLMNHRFVNMGYLVAWHSWQCKSGRELSNGIWHALTSLDPKPWPCLHASLLLSLLSVLAGMDLHNARALRDDLHPVLSQFTSDGSSSLSLRLAWTRGFVDMRNTVPADGRTSTVQTVIQLSMLMCGQSCPHNRIGPKTNKKIISISRY